MNVSDLSPEWSAQISSELFEISNNEIQVKLIRARRSHILSSLTALATYSARERSM